MVIEQLEKIEAVLKVLEKASFNNLNVQDQYINVKILDRFAITLKELKDELKNKVD